MVPYRLLTRFYIVISLAISLLLLFSVNTVAQTTCGLLQGTVKDGSNNTGLSGVIITKDTAGNGGTISLPGGKYLLKLIDDTHTLYFSYPGYQTKIVSKVEISSGASTTLDIFLIPLATNENHRPNKKGRLDSASNNATTFSITAKKEKSNIIYNPLNNSNTATDKITASNIQAGTDKNAAQLLNRLNGIIVQNNFNNRITQAVQVNGMGERYNQILFNGSVMNSFSPTSRAYPLELLPAEAIEEVALSKTASAALPADFAGGTIEIKTKDIPDQNFYLLQIGAGYSSSTKDKNFLGDKKNNTQFISFPGSIRNMPDQFPNARSRVFLHENNIQQQTDFSKLLNNNLAPVNYGKAEPDDRILFGFGKIYKLKKGLTIGVTGYINHIKQQVIEESMVQAAPNLTDNPYPFLDLSKKLIQAQSQDVNYNYLAQLGGMLNASFYFRKNKISIRNYFGSQFNNSLLVRSNIAKPNEDTLAGDGLRYTTEQRKFIYTQVAGNHAFGEKGNFIVDWQATYNHINQQNPDERNFLLRKDNTNPNLFEIARPLSPDYIVANFIRPLSPGQKQVVDANFINTGRLWRSFTENNFTAAINIKLPINLLNRTQILRGALYMQNTNRNLESNFLLVKGTGFFTLSNLLAPERYFPGGLTVVNYYRQFNRISNLSGITGDYERANYFGSSNLTASYLGMDNHLPKNIFLQWGFRLESNNQSAATVQYEFPPEYRYPQRFVTDDNTRQVNFTVLPAANIMYAPVKAFQINASYARTVNRPQQQEMNGYRYYDAANFLVKTGNPFLDNALINNYDAGVKWLVNASTHLTVNGFYKKIDQPIEEVVSTYSTGTIFSMPFNTPTATVQGLQAGFRLGLSSFTNVPWLSAISLFGSCTIQKSKVDAGPLRSFTIPAIETHTLSGTPDYFFNAGIVIQYPRLPELSVVYNQTGDYISKVGSGNIVLAANGNSVTAVPHYIIKGRAQLDAQLAQQLFKGKLQIIAGVNNLINNPFIEYQDLNGNKKFDAPLKVTSGIGTNGFYKSGTDNAVINIKTQQNFYIRLSYLF
jgi:outer membrane receptor protein involved in Fe transport